MTEISQNCAAISRRCSIWLKFVSLLYKFYAVSIETRIDAHPFESLR